MKLGGVVAFVVSIACLVVHAAAAPTEDQLQKIESFVIDEDYEKALTLVEGLLLLHPDDAQLVAYKKDLQSIVSPEVDRSGAKATPQLQPADETAGRSPALTQEDRVVLAALKSIGQELSQAAADGDAAATEAAATEYLKQSAALMRRQPGHVDVWAGRALAAIAIDHVEAGWEAGQQLQRSKASSGAAITALSELKRKGWLGSFDDVVGRFVQKYLDDVDDLVRAVRDLPFDDPPARDGSSGLDLATVKRLRESIRLATQQAHGAVSTGDLAKARDKLSAAMESARDIDPDDSPMSWIHSAGVIRTLASLGDFYGARQEAMRSNTDRQRAFAMSEAMSGASDVRKRGRLIGRLRRTLVECREAIDDGDIASAKALLEGVREKMAEMLLLHPPLDPLLVGAERLTLKSELERLEAIARERGAS